MADEDLAAEEVVEDAEVASEEVELDEIDQIASEMGWAPKEQWKGDEADWVDSRQFLKKTREINHSLTKSIKSLEKQVEGIGRANAAMTQRAIDEARAKWEAEKDRAYEEGDKEAGKRADDELRKLETVNVPAQGDDSEVKAWIEKNPWFNSNRAANALATKVTMDFKHLPFADQLELAEKEVRGKFPELFEDKPAQKGPVGLAKPGRVASPAPREKGYTTLPGPSRKACDDWVKGQHENGNTWATKEMWAEQYYAQEAKNG